MQLPSEMGAFHRTGALCKTTVRGDFTGNKNTKTTANDNIPVCCHVPFSFVHDTQPIKMTLLALFRIY